MGKVFSTATPNVPRQIKPQDRWLVDNAGDLIGVQNPNANGDDLLPLPIPLTAAQIASPTADVLANVKATYMLNVAPYTRYSSNGTVLIALGGGSAAFGVLQVISGSLDLILDANSQEVIYGSLTVQDSAILTISGQLRVYNWT